jgi:hypothetical protein
MAGNIGHGPGDDDRFIDAGGFRGGRKFEV